VTVALLAGALAGLGLYLFVLAVARPAPSVGVRLARLDAVRAGTAGRRLSELSEGGTADGDAVDRVRRTLGRHLETWAATQGLRLPRLRADLDVLGRPLGVHLATKVLFATGALLWAPLMWGALLLFGVPLPPAIPVVLGLGLAAAAFFLPDLQVHGEAQQRRKDFRHVMSSYLDLVAMNLAGGRGLPEALVTSASIGDHWAMARIRQALVNARMLGLTPWEALGRLGQELGVDELRDLAGALTLAGDEGAKIRASLSARAESMRRKQLAEVEGSAGERSQSMLIAQLLLCAAFLIFLAFPAAYNILNS
jgi:Flp pilus assembly protein TadB